LKAKYFEGVLNSADNDEAIRLLQHAIAIDPNFAAAYADLATEYRNKRVSLSASDKELEDKALSAVTTALRLDPDLAEAHLSRCLLLWTPAKGFPHALAIDECRRAVELNPNLDEAHHHLANMYNHIGLLDKGQEELQKALEINPFNAGARFRIGVNLTYQCKYEQALTAFREATEYSRILWSYQVSYVLFELGRKDESAAIVEKYLKEFPHDEGGMLTSMKALLAASAGNTKESLENVKRAAEIGKDYIHFHHTTYAIASTYALLNKRDEALEWLRKTADTGFPCYPLFERDPNLNNLREDPKFQAFMKTLKEQWERYKATL
jgi:tetratricopeptide (TPR) repeat protein